jgi:mRNA interferase RelE/StbE
MDVEFEITYHKKVLEEDIPLLSTTGKLKIQSAIEDKLTEHPDVFGKSLRRSLKGYRKLRVGDYRIIFRIAGQEVLIFGILHRSVVYQIMENR